MHSNAIEAPAAAPPIRGPLETVDNAWSAAVTKKKYCNKLTELSQSVKQGEVL